MVVVCAVLLFALWLAAFRVRATMALDLRLYDVFWRPGDGAAAAAATRLVALGNPWVFPWLAAGVLSIAAVRRRFEPALAGAAVMVGAGITTQLLKWLTAEPRAFVEPVSWPSGHETAICSLAVALVLVVPPGRRLVAALAGAGLAAGVALGILLLGTHHPSDLLGAWLVVAGWTAGVLHAGPAVLARARERGVALHG
jgi:membrane-associated phospholipid phosphatase